MEANTKEENIKKQLKEKNEVNRQSFEYIKPNSNEAPNTAANRSTNAQSLQTTTANKTQKEISNFQKAKNMWQEKLDGVIARREQEKIMVSLFVYLRFFIYSVSFLFFFGFACSC